MDIEKTVSFVVSYLADYWYFFAETLRNPAPNFKFLQPHSNQSSTSIVNIAQRNGSNRSKLSPQLLSFIAISIFIGSTLNKIIPGSNTVNSDFTTILVVTMAVWFFFSFLLYLACRLFQGNGSFETTLSIGLQLLSVIYVIASLIALIGGVILAAFRNSILVNYSYTSLPGISSWLQPLSIFFCVEFLLWLIYIPLALKHTHHFGVVRRYLVGLIVASVFSLLSLANYYFVTIPFGINYILWPFIDSSYLAFYLMNTYLGFIFLTIFFSWLGYSVANNLDEDTTQYVNEDYKIICPVLPRYQSVIWSHLLLGAGMFCVKGRKSRRWVYVISFPVMLIGRSTRKRENKKI